MRFHTASRALRRLLMATALSTVALGTPASASVHPEATLKSPLTSVAAGAALPLQGEEFLPGDAVQLVLRGPLSEYLLGPAVAADDGTFAIELSIPADVDPGGYRLVALSSDGDVSASLELTVAPAAPVGSGAGAQDQDEHDAMTPVARSDERPIERSRAGIEWGVLGLLVGLAAGWGLGLLRSA